MNISFPGGSVLTFAWFRSDRFSFILPGFLLVSFIAHAATFFLFQIVYPERVTISPPAPSVTVLDARRPDHQALWRLIDAEDPAPTMAAQTAVPEQLLEFPYRPSYHTVRTWPQTLAEAPAALQYPTPRDPIEIVRSANPPPPAPEPPAVRVQSRVIFGGDLTGRALQRPLQLSFKTNPAGPLAPARFLLGVNDRGEVAFTFLQSSSGDPTVDAAAAAQLARLAFAPNASPATWGHAVFVWGDDVYGAAELPEKKSPR